MLWKTRFGFRIYSSQNGVHVFDNYYCRWFTFGNQTLQTVLYKRKPSKPALAYINALIVAARMDPGHCCLLGLGGGGVAHALSPFLKHYSMTAIDSNEEVIAVASQFFKIGSLSNLKIIKEDAYNFIINNSQYFKYVMVDLFGMESFPQHCYTKQFFLLIKEKLSKEGILSVNITNCQEQRFILFWLRELFNNSTLVIPIKNCSNLVILAGEKKGMVALIEYLKNQKKIKRFIWDSLWGPMAEIA